MHLSRLTKPTRLIAGLLCGLLLAILAVPLGAQPASTTHPAQGFGPVYDASHEITLNGTIQEFVTKRVVGSPTGMHLLVAGPDGVVDARVGPFLSKETKEALRNECVNNSYGSFIGRQKNAYAAKPCLKNYSQKRRQHEPAKSTAKLFARPDHRRGQKSHRAHSARHYSMGIFIPDIPNKLSGPYQPSSERHWPVWNRIAGFVARHQGAGHKQ